MLNILDPKWQLFVKVADAGSVTAAALALDMQQSVVSRHIARLEEESGTRLFRRTGRGVVLTEFGEQVYPRVMALIRDAEQLADDMRTSKDTPIGDVRVGLLPSAVAVLAGPLFSAVQKAWPQVRLHLTEGSSAQLEELLLQGRLDLALLLREEDTATPDETVLTRLSLYLIVPAKDPLAKRRTIDFEEVATLPLVLPSEPHPLRGRLARLVRQKGLALTQVLEADSIRLQHEIAAIGGGYAITAGTLTAGESRRLAAVRIVRPVLARSIVLGVTAHRAHTRATREVMRLLKRMAPDILKPTTQT
ncbi:LysR family transcriptional regulator [Variovorax ginsengisoli]|uniref:DNA-binding transcriptional LysR family regulator n=1 Tax=Variovorax ginsengisoli TaxID=363844 RepID=A0ABT9S9T2_9BURK|nr:LysR family transcriptional regulator [Variovorax ginsengisoli]MDP9901119.1 DNA-binding transcriptional LysR family regulator [Variovorax ginsengisoli]